MKHHIIAALVLLCGAVAMMPPSNHDVYAQDDDSATLAPVVFYAEYLRIFYDETKIIRELVMSDDASTIFLITEDKETDVRQLVRINVGGNASIITIPDQAERTLANLTVNVDGSVAYIMSQRYAMPDWVYHVSGGVATRILNLEDRSSDVWPQDRIRFVATIASGDFLYFSDGFDLWRVGAAGGLEQVLNDTDIIRQDNNERGYHIYEIAVADDGNTIAFMLNGSLNDDDGLTLNGDVFVYNGGSVSQVTDFDGRPYLSNLTISGNGAVIVVEATVDTREWYMTICCSLNARPIQAVGSNFGGIELVNDGSFAFYADETVADGGSLLTSDGSRFALFADAIHARQAKGAQISADGRIIAFYEAHYDDWGAYVGYLNPLTTQSAAPKIANYGIVFNDDNQLELQAEGAGEDLESLHVTHLTDGDIIYPNEADATRFPYLIDRFNDGVEGDNIWGTYASAHRPRNLRVNAQTTA